jgi:shikimate dehydrogenase
MTYPDFQSPIGGTTQLLGVIGDPIEHSLSPVMHNAALAAIAHQQALPFQPYVYVPLHIPTDQFEAAIAGLWAMQWQGFNITIPHKQRIIPHLQEISPLAQAVGAVNTVWRTQTGWAGTNTDVYGFITPLKQALAQESWDWPQRAALVLGCGGAARAVIAGCAQLNLGQIHVVGRDPQALAALKSDMANGPLAIALSLHHWDEAAQLLPQVSLVVNTTPVGMFPRINESPLDAMAIATLPRDAVVYDLIYTPRPTRLLQWAADQGYRTLDGLPMLIHPGAEALAQWIGSPPPIEIMMLAAQQALVSA